MSSTPMRMKKLQIPNLLCSSRGNEALTLFRNPSWTEPRHPAATFNGFIFSFSREREFSTFFRQSMQIALKIKLSIFMFLQYFVWGSWYVSMGAYMANVLKFSGQEIGAAYGAFAIGSMISPFFVGLIADRYFASQKMLAVLGVVGGVALCALPSLGHFKSFYPVLILYCALYTPTL